MDPNGTGGSTGDFKEEAEEEEEGGMKE